MVRQLHESEEYLEDSHDENRKRRILDERFLRESIAELDPAKPVCAERGSSVGEVVREMQRRHIGCMLVVERGRLVGIFTERDLLQDVAGSGLDLETTPVDGVMTESPETLRADDTIVYALNKMSLGGFRHVPLVDGSGTPVGVISVKDIIDYIAEFFAHDVHTLPPEPGLAITKSRDGA
jgi:CBS domain-containing protein